MTESCGEKVSSLSIGARGGVRLSHAVLRLLA